MMRHRRLRRTQSLRELVRETRLDISDFIYPIFVTDAPEGVQAIPSMPGQYRYSLDALPAEIGRVAALGIRAVLLFGISAVKDEAASAACDDAGIVQRAVAVVRRTAPGLTVMTDVCVCAYTPHGHCGVVHDGNVDNDATLDILARMAVSHARAGADVVAPSAMMDGQVAAIRSALDAGGLSSTAIMAYSAKYRSAFYGPFREAAGSSPQFGDRSGYQMDAANAREAVREIGADIAEGADIVMVKPALAYMDIIRNASERFDVPIAAYNVSGEYSMVKAAALQGWIDEREVVMEMLLSLKRAGAGLLITYFATDVAQWLQEQ